MERRPFREGDPNPDYAGMVARLREAAARYPGCHRFNGAFEPLDGPEERTADLELELRTAEFSLL